MPKRKAPPAEEPAPGIFSVDLDAESFTWLHDMLKAKLKYHYLPTYYEMVKRTLVAFDDAERRVNGDQPEPEPPPKRKRVIPRQK